MKAIDLNADLGEGGDFDAELLEIVSSASVACGGHAGSDEIMRETLLAAKAQDVRTGAHPGFIDPENFGRRELDLSFDAIADQVVLQIRRILAVGEQVGQIISYVKLHGALYNMTAQDGVLAEHLFGVLRREFGPLPMMALEGSAQIAAATRLDTLVIREGFADRAYANTGNLVPRSVDGAVLHDAAAVVQQAVRMARDGEIVAVDGTLIASNVQSICLHGDNVAALELAKAVQAGLRDANIAVSSKV